MEQYQPQKIIALKFSIQESLLLNLDTWSSTYLDSSDRYPWGKISFLILLQQPSQIRSHMCRLDWQKELSQTYICSLMNARPLACQLSWAFPHCYHEGISKLFREACSFWQSVNECKTFFDFGSGSSCTWVLVVGLAVYGAPFLDKRLDTMINEVPVVIC